MNLQKYYLKNYQATISIMHKNIKIYVKSHFSLKEKNTK